MRLAPAELRQPVRVPGERDRPGRLAAVDAADQDAIDARGVEVGQDRQGLAALRDLCGDLDPPPAGGEQGVAPAVEVRDRRSAVADAGHGVEFVFQAALLFAAHAKGRPPRSQDRA